MLDDAPKLPLLNDWRQGDFALGEFELPMIGIDTEGTYFGSIPVPGAVIISQSCDIVRSHDDRPFVQIAALAPATTAEIASIEARKKPRYGFLTPLKEHGLVVDFDVVASTEKKLVATWDRQTGCASDHAQREFATAIARHKHRFAFPDEFNAALKPLRRWIQRRADKQNAAGAMLRSIEQIRVRCNDWSKSGTDIEFVGVLLGDPTLAERQTWILTHTH